MAEEKDKLLFQQDGCYGCVVYSRVKNDFIGLVDGLICNPRFEGSSFEEMHKNFHETVTKELQLAKEHDNEATILDVNGEITVKISPKLHFELISVAKKMIKKDEIDIYAIDKHINKCVEDALYLYINREYQ